LTHKEFKVPFLFVYRRENNKKHHENTQKYRMMGAAWGQQKPQILPPAEKAALYLG